MRRFGLVCLFVAVCSPVCGNVLLTIPSRIVPPNLSNSASTFSLDLGLTVPTGSQALVSYDLSLQVTGGSGLSITGTGSGLPANPIFPTTPSFQMETDPNGAGTLYYFGDFSSSAGTITASSNLLRAKASLAAGTTSGTYQIDALVSASDPLTTVFYSGVTSSGGLVTINGWTQQDASISIALPGDAELDGKVDVNDLTIVLAHYGQTGMSWTTGDFEGDGKVDINDLTIVLSHFGQSQGSSAARVAAAPEPSTWLMIGIGLAAMIWLRARTIPAT
jgi:hypothetical protein